MKLNRTNTAHGYTKETYEPESPNNLQHLFVTNPNLKKHKRYVYKRYHSFKQQQHVTEVIKSLTLYEELQRVLHPNHEFNAAQLNYPSEFVVFSEHVENEIAFFTDSENIEEHYAGLVKMYAAVKHQHRLAYIKDPSPYNIHYSNGNLVMIDESSIWLAKDECDYENQVISQVPKMFNQIRGHHECMKMFQNKFLIDIDKINQW